jgi:hypothetical protein
METLQLQMVNWETLQKLKNYEDITKMKVIRGVKCSFYHI